jgi:hypothetical protein
MWLAKRRVWVSKAWNELDGNGAITYLLESKIIMVYVVNDTTLTIGNLTLEAEFLLVAVNPTLLSCNSPRAGRTNRNWLTRNIDLIIVRNINGGTRESTARCTTLFLEVTIAKSTCGSVMDSRVEKDTVSCRICVCGTSGIILCCNQTRWIHAGHWDLAIHPLFYAPVLKD